MARAVVNFADGPFVAGQERLRKCLEDRLINPGASYLCFPPSPRSLGGTDWPTQEQKPYAFKAYALREAWAAGFLSLLWCDASVVAIRDLSPIWERIERDGYWINKNGWNNYEWTADSAYPHLFSCDLETARVQNKAIEHVRATAFGLSTTHPVGRKIFEEFYRLAAWTDCFCGPYANSNFREFPGERGSTIRPWGRGYAAPCGPEDVRGHRYDQTALSVIAWRQGCQLTSDWIVYDGEEIKPETVLLIKAIE